LWKIRCSIFVDSRRDIFVVTAQILVNALKNKEIEAVTAFSMMVFDECHHTNNDHRFNEIMKLYMRLKLDGGNHANLPQV